MKLKLVGHQCECAACNELFGRLSTFDKHRTGEHGNRRCLTAREMEGLGWRRNVKGFWKRAPRKAA